MLSLGFFNPLLLWALPLAAVPIIIHLLNRRRFNKIRWAAMEYLLRAMKRNRRRLQMEQWIILLLRTLAVVFLVFLVTRPQLGGSGGLLRARAHHIVCLDDSASMAQRVGAGTVYRAGVDRVHKLVSKLAESDSGDLFTLLVSSGHDKQPLLFATRVGPQLKKKVREALAGQVVGDASLNPGDLLAAARKWGEEKKKDAGDLHYYLVTDSRDHDFVVSGKPQPGVLKHLEEMDPAHARMTLMIVGPKETDNLGVTAVRRRDRLAMSGASVTLEVDITNFGDENSTATELAVEIDGKSRVVRPIEPIAAGERATIDIEHTFREPGFHGVVATLNRDRFPVDDNGSLALEVVGTSQVLVVNGDQADAVEDSETFFLDAALDTGSDVLSGITVTEILPHNLPDYDLGHINMVWLANLSVPRPEVVEKLEKFVAGGGGLVTFLGNQVDPLRYNKSLYKDGKGLLPLPLGELKGDMDRPDSVFVADPTHVLIKDNYEFFDLVFSKMVLVKRYFEMLEDPAAPVSIPLRIKSANGSPLMASKTFQQGGLSIVIGTTADLHWTDFCTSMAFLVTCQEIHKHATRVHSVAPYNLRTAGTLRIDLDPSEYRRDVLVSALGGEGFEATYTAADKDEQADGRISSTLTVPMRDLEGLGLFRVTMNPHRGEAEQRLLARHAPKAEGRLQRLSKQGWLKYYKGLGDRLEVVDEGTTDAGTAEAGEGEIWRILALALLLFLLLETVLAWRFGRR